MKTPNEEKGDGISLSEALERLDEHSKRLQEKSSEASARRMLAIENSGLSASSKQALLDREKGRRTEDGALKRHWVRNALNGVSKNSLSPFSKNKLGGSS